MLTNCDAQLSEAAHQVLRPALKLLITTTLLNLVPKVTDLPESLFSSLYHLPSPAFPDFAPRLLTRQIKASIYLLQQYFLQALFSHFTDAMELDAEVKLAIAILVAHALDLVRSAGRDFAKYFREFSSTIMVSKHDVTEYETNVQAHLFGRVWASVLDTNVRGGGLDMRLRSLCTSLFRLTLYPLSSFDYIPFLESFGSANLRRRFAREGKGEGE